ncbi:hypothetical protein C2G38_2155619 [Gigaspora rosea]|uniref:Uncharacterized protein n=1 Tax=Gigaspora rosea TaxID=44941 RepID=A0A397WA21_9GLOM|nr:hypothetical protein C2G38_2155619 [Gigaspora rosea]
MEKAPTDVLCKNTTLDFDPIIFGESISRCICKSITLEKALADTFCKNTTLSLQYRNFGSEEKKALADARIPL